MKCRRVWRCYKKTRCAADGGCDSTCADKACVDAGAGDAATADGGVAAAGSGALSKALATKSAGNGGAAAEPDAATEDDSAQRDIGKSAGAAGGTAPSSPKPTACGPPQKAPWSSKPSPASNLRQLDSNFADLFIAAQRRSKTGVERVQ